MAEANFKLDGELSMGSVAAVHRRALATHKAGRLPEVIDLGHVSRCDSAGLALLLEIKSWANSVRRPLQFTNPPKSLQVLADLSQAGTLLGWSPEET